MKKSKFLLFVFSLSSWLCVWASVRIARLNGWSEDEAREVALQRADEPLLALRAHFEWYKPEVEQFLPQRLEKRYDLGAAMNEATQRAVEHKKAQGERVQLTPRQEAALKHQQVYLQGVIDRS